MKTAGVEAIGTLRKAKVAYYNRNTKKCEEHLCNENMEVTSMLGNITMMEKKPFLHPALKPWEEGHERGRGAPSLG